MELDYSVSLAEQYGINSQEYVGTHVTSLPFSVRITNRFQNNNIHTVADLLEKTPDDLMRMRGFGKGCLIEIDKFFSSATGNSLPHPINKVHLSPNFIRQYKLGILQGDFSFEYERLPEKEQKELCDIRKDYEVLGPDLINECIVNPLGAMKISHMLQTFYFNVEKAAEVASLLEGIPAYRRQNLVLGYINTYTQDKDERKLLASLYDSDDAALSQINIERVEGQGALNHVRSFLKWCAFNLEEDISALINLVNEQAKLKTIVEMRAQRLTLENCGNKLGITRERVRQLEVKAFRIFAKHQDRTKLILKISAEKNGDAIITPADIEHYSGKYSTVLLYLLRNLKNDTYAYDEQLDLFVIGDDSLCDQVHEFIEALPSVFSVKKLSEYLTIAADENNLPATMVEMAIYDSYQLTGRVYHRSRLPLATIYTVILQEYFPNGIKASNPVEISRFRSLVKANFGNVKIPENDRALLAGISRTCVLCGRGMYRLKQEQYIPDCLARQIYNYIVNSNDDIFLMNTLFSVFESDLRKAGVDNKYYLQGILRELYGDVLVFTRDYVSKDGGETSIYSSVVGYIQQSDYPVSKNQIQERFPGISDVVISFSVNNPHILNYFGEYLHASKLNLTAEEERYLNKVVHRVCGGAVHHIKDIYKVVDEERPEIFRRNAALCPFSAFSVLEYLLGDHYQFARPYVALQGVEIGSPAERLHDFIYGTDEFSFDDISDFTRENHFSLQSMLDYVNSCNDKFLIVNGAIVRAIDRLGVTEEIAYEVEKIVAGEVRGTMPISQLTCWAAFPTINVPWTEWLVYSVLNKWSTQLSVAPSSNQFRFSIPLVAPKGMLDPSPFADTYKDGRQSERPFYTAADNLDNIDDILAEMLGDELLEDDIWH